MLQRNVWTQGPSGIFPLFLTWRFGQGLGRQEREVTPSDKDLGYPAVMHRCLCGWCLINLCACIFSLLLPLSLLLGKKNAFCFQDHIQHSFLWIVCGHGHWEGQTTQVGFLGSSIQSQPISKWADIVGEEEAEEGGKTTQTNQPKSGGGLSEASSRPPSCPHTFPDQLLPSEPHTHFTNPLFNSALRREGEGDRESEAKMSHRFYLKVQSKFSSWKGCQMGTQRLNPSAYPQKRKQQAKLFTNGISHNHQRGCLVVWVKLVDSPGSFLAVYLSSHQ